MLRIKFKTDNAAFGDTPQIEIVRILRDVADRIEGGGISGQILDVNGNTIGEYAATWPKYQQEKRHK